MSSAHFQRFTIAVNTLVWICIISVKSPYWKPAKVIWVKWNISANGFAFVSGNEFFADCKGQKIRLEIENFELTSESTLEGRILRSSDNNGIYIVGCQMPEDNPSIMKYVAGKLEKQKKSPHR